MDQAQHSTSLTATLSVLRAHYPVALTLRSYLECILDDEGSCLRGLLQATPENYRGFLNTCYIATHTPFRVSKRITPLAPMSHMQDVIDRAQERLFLRAKGSRPSNIITAGYRKVGQQDARSKIGVTRVPLTNYFVNTMITALQGPEWEALLQRIGENAMFHLLTETSIFLSLPNGCLCQMVGEPIFNLRTPTCSAATQVNGPLVRTLPSRGTKRRCIGGYNEEPPAKRQRCEKPPKRQHFRVENPERVAPADVAFLRARMFYARPSFVPHTSRSIVGLSPKHVLNGFYPAWRPTNLTHDGQWVDPDPRERMEHARHLAKYVFPRQYGLSNAFTITSGRKYGTLRGHDYLDREQEIKNNGPCKTPKRLKHVLDMLEKMIWQHHKCKYKLFLDLTCPSKLVRDSSSSLDSSVILEMMSETSIQLQTQQTPPDTSISLDSAGRPIISHAPSQAKRLAKYKPQFAEFFCGSEEVFRYAVLVTKAVVPRTFWGSNKNFEVVTKHIKHMVTARRYETLTVHSVLQEFRSSDCEWLMPHSAGALKQTRVSVTDSLKRQELLEEFLFWYFDSFLIPLLKTTFYVTESSAFRNRVLYFRHDDWTTLCAPLVEKLSTDTFQRIDKTEAQEILRQRKLGFSFVRLLPKETGVRPIVNLRRRIDNKDPYKPTQSINQILQAAFQILTYEKTHQPHSLGASVFGPNEIYTKLKAFKTRLTGGNLSVKLPQLYFIKVDVQACFDTIEQTKLLGILRDMLSEDGYMIQRYATVNKAGERVQRRYIKKALPEDDHPHFIAYAAQLAETLRNTILIDQVVYPYSRKQDIISLLEEHITENLVKIGSEYYRQVVGIPQGSVLSAILCSFFYGDLERKKFKFTEDPECVLMRLIDDWLLVTTSLSKATRFYDMVSTGHPEYGCFISKEKSLINFDHPALVNIVDPRSKVFPWCGYSINMTDLSVTVDYTRYHSTYLQDSLTVDFGRRPGAAFAYKMMQLAKSKSHIIYNDAGLNSRHAIYLNIYQNFTVLAMKMHHYLRQWRCNPDRAHVFLMKTIRQSIRFSYTSICTKASHKLAQANNARTIVQEVEVTWLGLHSFHTVFSRKPQAYTRILKSLRFELSLPKYRRFKKQYRTVIAEGLSTLTSLYF